MNKVNVFEVKAKLSEYLDRAATGERILICRHNQPVAELRAVPEDGADARPVGPLPGRPTFELPPVFFEPLPGDELDLWDGVSSPTASGDTRVPGRASRAAESTVDRRAGRPRARKRSRR